MFIHLGAEIVVRSKDIVAILDCSKREIDERIHSLLNDYKKSGTFIWISEESIKSIVVTEQHIYGSPISSTTLTRRSIYDDQ